MGTDMVHIKQPEEKVATLLVDILGESSGDAMNPHDFKAELDRLTEKYGTVYVSVEEVEAFLAKVEVWR